MTSFHVRLPQPNSSHEGTFAVTANALMVSDADTLAKRSVSHMGCYSRYHAGRLLHFGLCILSWRRS